MYNVVITLSHHSPRWWKQPQRRQVWEKLLRPEAAVEAEAKLIEVALQMFFAYAMISSQEEGLQIGDQGVYPAQGSAVLIKDLVVVDISLTQRGAKGPEGITVNLASKTNGALNSGPH